MFREAHKVWAERDVQRSTQGMGGAGCSEKHTRYVRSGMFREAHKVCEELDVQRSTQGM